MFAHYYTNWMLLNAGPVLDPYVPFFFFFFFSHYIVFLRQQFLRYSQIEAAV